MLRPWWHGRDRRPRTGRRGPSRAGSTELAHPWCLPLAGMTVGAQGRVRHISITRSTNMAPPEELLGEYSAGIAERDVAARSDGVRLGCAAREEAELL